uniref:(California timema) hypothetical protein n=1 Tax=Timema californicum TaxID=61474 RepID=A0A7R9JLU8_TIMCA|nr:unnamed protein product [Timema californicum]
MFVVATLATLAPTAAFSASATVTPTARGQTNLTSA